MGLSYDRFKSLVRHGEINNFRNFQWVITNLEEFYQSMEQFLIFYPKNIFNDKETELLFFLKDGFLSLKQTEDERWIYEHSHSKVLSKKLVATRYINGNHELSIVYDNGTVINLNNLEDSNFDWESGYSETIRNLYKTI